MTDVTVVGLGAMGAALAGALLRAGFGTTVWNRSPEKADELVKEGASLAVSPGEAVAASPLTILCVLDYAGARQVLEAAGSALGGRVIVNLTNGTPDDARRMAEWVEAQGARYMDGGILAIPPMIGGSDAFILYSGSGEGFDTHRKALECLGTARFLGSDAGLAPLFDLALLSAMYGLFGGFLHGAALVGTEGVDAGAFIELAVPWLNAMTGALPQVAEQIDAGDYETGATSGLAMQQAGLDNILAASRAQGVKPDLMLPIRDLVAKRVAQGHGADDIAGIVELIRRRVPMAWERSALNRGR